MDPVERLLLGFAIITAIATLIIVIAIKSKKSNKDQGE